MIEQKPSIKRLFPITQTTLSETLWPKTFYWLEERKKWGVRFNLCEFSKSDHSRDLKHRGDKSLDLLSFPMKNLIFQQSIVNISESLKLKFVKFCDVHLPLHLFPVVFFYTSNLQWNLQNLLLKLQSKFATIKWYNLCLQIIQSQTCYPIILHSITALWCMRIPDRWTQKYSANGIATGFENISSFGLINPTGNKAEELQIIFWVPDF